MPRIAVAAAFTAAIVVASGDAEARARFRMSSPSPKPVAAAPMPKSVTGQPGQAGAAAAEAKSPFAAARPANPQPVGGGTFVVIGGPRPAAAGPQGAQGAPEYRAMGDGASGPLQFDPSLAAADDKAAAKQPATECLTTPQTVAAKEPLVAKEQPKEQIAASESPKIEPATPRTNPALVPVRPKRQAAPVLATVCYVQRDGSCLPSH